MDLEFMNLKYLFVAELLYLVLLALVKLILPLRSINKSRINKKIYYRDELSNYSPFINAFLLNRNIFDADVIVAMFLYLESKGYDGSKTYKNDNLLPHELNFIQNQDFYLSFFKANDYNNMELMRFKNLIVSDMVNENILKKESRNLYVDIIDLISILFLLVHLFLSTKLLPNIPENSYIVQELFYSIALISIYACSHWLNLSIIRFMTPKGKIYYEDLLASKKFLKDFSIISSRNIDEKYLWDSYLYNAILFNLHGKLDQDAQKYYESLLSKNNYYVNHNYDFSFLAFLPWLLLYFVGNWAFRFILQDFINEFLIICFITSSASYRILNNKIN